MNKVREIPSAYDSEVEREIAQVLEKTLTAPWRLQGRIQSFEVPSGERGLRYTPDFVIRNESTGESLSVEVKDSISLSMPNLMKLRDIQSAVESDGSKFLLLVCSGVSDAVRPGATLSEYGLNAVTVRGATDAARVIEQRLMRQS